jgi:large subunit ribosomal protein L31
LFGPKAPPRGAEPGDDVHRKKSPNMQKDIHPRYVNCTVTCGCGAHFQTRATINELRVEVCSVCHPFYSGKQRFVDSARRVDKFLKKYGKSEAAKK